MIRVGGVERQEAGDLLKAVTITRSGVRRSELCIHGKGQMDTTINLTEGMKGLITRE